MGNFYEFSLLFVVISSASLLFFFLFPNLALSSFVFSFQSFHCYCSSLSLSFFLSLALPLLCSSLFSPRRFVSFIFLVISFSSFLSCYSLIARSPLFISLSRPLPSLLIAVISSASRLYYFPCFILIWRSNSRLLSLSHSWTLFLLSPLSPYLLKPSLSRQCLLGALLYGAWYPAWRNAALRQGTSTPVIGTFVDLGFVHYAVKPCVVARIMTKC